MISKTNGKKAHFDKVHVRPVTRRKIKVLAIFYGSEVDFIDSLINPVWEKALAEEKVNDHMLAEPVGKQPQLDEAKA